MISSRPVRAAALVVVLVVGLLGVRGLLGGVAGTSQAGSEVGGTSQVSIEYVVDGDTVQVLTPQGRSARVRILGIIH